MSFGNFPKNFLKFSRADVSEENEIVFCFKSFRLDVGERQLLHHGRAVPLTPKAFDVLTGHLVEKEELLAKVWEGSYVEEVNVARTIHTLRKILGEDDKDNRFIETVAKKGYRFVAKVTEPGDVDDHEPERATPNVLSFVQQPTVDEAILAQSENRTTGDRFTANAPRNTRIVLFAIGFLTAISLVLLLSFDFQPISSGESNATRSIAVLPLKPINAANRDEIYELGIADSLIHRLSASKELRVRPLSATRKYSDLEQDAIAAGKEQMVDYVLSANYQLADGRIRVTAQLLNVASGQTEETKVIEADAGSIFAIQDAIASEVGRLLQARFSFTSDSQKTKRGTDNEDAYRLYLQGTALADKRTQDEVRKAIEYFEEAIRLDPNYALACARLANAQIAAISNLSKPPREQYPKAISAIERALAIDNNLAEAHSYLGEIKAVFERDMAGAEREHKKAVELDPNSSVVHRMYALLLSSLGKHDESLTEIKTAITLEPASVLNHLIFGRILLFARRYDEAIVQLERTAEMDSDRFFAHQSLILAYRCKGDDDRAFDAFLRARMVGGEERQELDAWRALYSRSGWRGISERQFAQAKKDERDGKPNNILLANLSIELGQHEQALAYLEKAFADPRSISLLKVHPRYDPLRGDSRFNDLLKRDGF